MDNVNSIWLTASGGPFRTISPSEFHKITPSDALNHPTWNMGPKISVDSATMMNKGLEIIEAHWLFQVDGAAIKVVVHPQSIVHSMVEFDDGSFLAHLGRTDMKLPISYALNFPERCPTHVPVLNPLEMSKLEFYPPDFNKFPCLKLAYDVLEMGGFAAATLNAANEVAVQYFLDRLISFQEISDVIRYALENNGSEEPASVEDIIKVDNTAREVARSYIINR
jgi:1-deoxy-D-xylulose-5-phosphate reductoisomerase